MTPQEHALMLLMFTRQAMVLKLLTDILKSRDILDDSDIEAFGSFVSAGQTSDPKIGKTIAKTYQAAATALGLDVGLKGF
jgi:hypothetical protein